MGDPEMPGKDATIHDLPDIVQEKLPKHAQEIYREAHNHALEECKDPKERRDPHESLEAVAHKVAWAAVEQEYTKNDTGEWVPRNPQKVQEHIRKEGH
jgi:cation transport regulator